MDDLLAKLPILFAGASALAAWCAVALSIRASLASKRALQIAERQEQRRKPVLVVYLVEGFSRQRDADRQLAFMLTLGNPTDIDNSVARIDLWISYRTAGNICAAVEIPVSRSDDFALGGSAHVRLLPPVRIDAHQSVTGWAHFRVTQKLLADCTIDGYKIRVTDTHSERAEADISIVREILGDVPST